VYAAALHSSAVIRLAAPPGGSDAADLFTNRPVDDADRDGAAVDKLDVRAGSAPTASVGGRTIGCWAI
jgi:hypothetical protein